MDFALAHALSQAAVFHDLPTAAHNWRVTMYAQAFAEVLELGESHTNRFMMAALLHDLGKIDVPHSILVKAEPLTPAEFSCMKQHTEHGFNRLRRMGERDEIILSVVRWHHERRDGTGYPDRLVDEEIPPAARHFAVIDAFDAMTSIRSYRPGAPLKTAENALEELRGTLSMQSVRMPWLSCSSCTRKVGSSRSAPTSTTNRPFRTCKSFLPRTHAFEHAVCFRSPRHRACRT